MEWESKKAAIASMGLPRDVLLGEVLVSFVGRQEVNIANYRSILIYTDCLVKLQAKTCKLVIRGSRLRIAYYSPQEMRVTGCIGAMEFET